MSAKQNSGLLGIPFQYMKSHEYKAWSEKKGDHLILVDLSGSLRDTEWKAANEEQAGYHYQPEIWFERIFSDHILPSFLSKVLYHPGDRLEVRVFGEDIEPLGNYSIDELFVTRHGRQG